jgi:GTPase
LKIPFFIVLTKVDLAPQNKYDETVSELKKLLKHKLLNKFPIEVKESTTENVQIYFILGNSENGLTNAIR